MHRRFIARLIVAVAMAATTSVMAAELTVEERAEGIAAVERLRQGWRSGTDVAAFERLYPAAIWRESAHALGRRLDRAGDRYGSETVAAALDRELDRMVAASLAPDRLAAIQAALGHDPATLRECLVLPRVAHRLDELMAGDPPELPVGKRSGSWEWWVSPMSFDARQFHSAAWTGNEMVVWGGRAGGQLDTGGMYEPATDTWIATSLVNAPAPRSSHTAVWTGDLMLVWGGYQVNQLAGYLDNVLVFEDGFESGDTSAWSAVEP